MTEQIKTSLSGYGIVFKNVMKDTNIDIEAKALYSYLSAYAGSNGTSFPSVGLICHELNISEKRFKKYRKQLEDYGYLSIKRNRTDNGFSNNIYTIEHNPVPGHFVPEQNVPEQNVSEQFVPGRFVPGQNVGTINNSIKNNSIINNNNTNNSSSCSNSISNGTSKQQQQSPFDFYQQNGFGVLKPYISEQISAWIDDFNESGNEIVIGAMKEALDNNVINWNYVNSILKAWHKAGIKSVSDIATRKLSKKQKPILQEIRPTIALSNEVNQKRQREFLGVAYEEFS